MPFVQPVRCCLHEPLTRVRPVAMSSLTWVARRRPGAECSPKRVESGSMGIMKRISTLPTCLTLIRGAVSGASDTTVAGPPPTFSLPLPMTGAFMPALPERRGFRRRRSTASHARDFSSRTPTRRTRSAPRRGPAFSRDGIPGSSRRRQTTFAIFHRSSKAGARRSRNRGGSSATRRKAGRQVSPRMRRANRGR